ncbi:MAG: LysR family transcriptional regulator [Erysipelotrichales bacterium]|nr:LysR family transcriptional regulator [Erysipelotrichales bacterium]
MNIDFELYRIFNEVANSGNITFAADKLHISQPAVSKSIKSLENQLGGTLFVRTKRGVQLTEEGKELHSYIKTAIEYIRNAENKFTDMINLNTGLIRIGISRTLVKEFLFPSLETFHKLYPNIKIEIVTNKASELIPLLRNGLVDVIVANLPVKQYQDIEIYNLKKINDIFVVSRNFKIDKTSINMEDIVKYPLILQPKGTNTRDYLDSIMAQYNIHLDPEMTLASYGLVQDMSKIGFGVGYVVKEFVSEDLKNGNLIEIKTTPKIPSRYIGLITKKDFIPSFATSKLIELLKSNN